MMSSSQVENKPVNGQPLGEPEEVDEELMALSGPLPSLRYGLFTGMVIVLSIAMLAWFYPDLHYFLQGLDEPLHLGDASDIDFSNIENNSYASVDGIPWVTKTIAFNEGIRWFSMSDTSRKLFPLTGQPNLFVQWTVPDEVKAYRDPRVNPSSPPLPSYFKGHLVQRGKFTRNYERLWNFVERELKIKVAPDVWLLIDGEMPGDKFWIVPVYLVFLVMIVVNAIKLRRFWIAWKAG
ncbi:MAG: hypothetical protein GY847_01865 [Proteobacteria bacterium]|nr:hypothetical protein [Pseudomonadota bacterium]